jgi:CPA2 family monovalent cation:H+ antiporter-2
MKPIEVLNPDYIGKSIRQSQIREKTNGLIVGLERGGQRKLNPESHEVLERGDILWIVGVKRLINQSMISSDSRD